MRPRVMNPSKRLMAALLITASVAGCARQPEHAAAAQPAGQAAAAPASAGQGIPTFVLIAGVGTLALLFLVASAGAPGSLMDGPS